NPTTTVAFAATSTAPGMGVWLATADGTVDAGPAGDRLTTVPDDAVSVVSLAPDSPIGLAARSRRSSRNSTCGRTALRAARSRAVATRRAAEREQSFISQVIQFM